MPEDQDLQRLYDLLENWSSFIERPADQLVYAKKAHFFRFTFDGGRANGGRLEKGGKVVYATNYLPNLIARLAEI